MVGARVTPLQAEDLHSLKQVAWKSITKPSKVCAERKMGQTDQRKQEAWTTEKRKTEIPF